ncbi:MAG: SpoIID/LytB domain-containing protein [Salibacteraceae bacterium]
MRFHLSLLIACFSFLGLCSSSFATTNVVKVGLFWKNEPTAVMISPVIGSYEVFADGKRLDDLSREGLRLLMLTASGNQIELKSLKKKLGKFSRVEFRRKSWGCNIRIKASTPSHPAKVFYDNLMVRSNGKLKIVNQVYIEHYIAGVVESEAGSKEPLEYYKVQAIICRTYALSNLRRHAGEGFHVCDKVHCQVYHHRSTTNPDIVKAVNATKGLVIVDSEIELITAAFSSNCGGTTCNSESVWTNPLPYLRSVNDTFCLEENHARWEKTVSRTAWLNYLEKHWNYPVNDTAYQKMVVNYCPEHRAFKLLPDHPHIPLKIIRRDWKLQSAYFNIKEEGDSIRFVGRGYGHGVGLCQEGAMRMAKEGVPYNQILHHYYTDVHLINLAVIDFFRSD